ncbi:MAG TPA: PIN domain-containing protein [Candidatus Sulfotelmatobacter sp.]|nr:PIN domain-containing protein [Candidatus Sulfotelmatobacter sp.]
MPASVFFDTNVLIYAISDAEPKAARAEALLASGGVVSVQVLNEFTSVARRKLQMQWPEITQALNDFLVLCPEPMPILLSTHEVALKIAQKYGFGVFDALVVASAIQAKCETLYSEDLQDGQVLENALTVRNPFK